MADKVKKEVKVASGKIKYKATNPSQFKLWYTDQAPSYSELSKGESVELDTNDKNVIDWLNNKIIIKE